MRSVWLCSSNEIISNLGVLAAAGGVALTRTPWTGLALGVLIAVVFLRSALYVMRQACEILGQPTPRPQPRVAASNPAPLVLRLSPKEPQPGAAMVLQPRSVHQTTAASSEMTES